jgi:hypothetical protein
MDSPPPNATNAALDQEIDAVYRLYVSLGPAMDPETGLGGKLLYVGELDPSACLLLRAANIAGATSLAASADTAALRQAMREGAIDFIVTTLSEALRILKNQIRKKEPVAVGVSLAPQAFEREMLDRGVQPDLLAPKLPLSPELAEIEAHGGWHIQPEPLPPGFTLNLIPVPHDWRRPLGAFDELLLSGLAAADHLNHRWVRAAPRYLSTEARHLRSIACDPETISRLTSASAKDNDSARPAIASCDRHNRAKLNDD